MKSRDAQIRMKRFQIEERRRQVGQIEKMIEFDWAGGSPVRNGVQFGIGRKAN